MAKKAVKRVHWRDLPEWMIHASPSGRTFNGVQTAESLHPSEATMIGYIEGDPVSRSIVEAWKFGSVEVGNA